MTEEEKHQSEQAKLFIKQHTNLLIETFANPKICLKEAHPVSLFMAGSPGAGKTEISKRLIERFDNKPIRIDADEIRELIPGYTGANSYLFQDAANKGVNILYDYVLDHNINVILDATFAYADAQNNVARSLKHNRICEIYYIYQEPEVAWDLTKKREAIEHRYVSREVFINSFIQAHVNVNNVKQVFKDQVELNLIIKDFDRNIEQIFSDIQKVDDHISKVYTTDELSRIIL
ncbi:MAG: zeta toxin family protein [Planctomycetes bacterium]|nr:zeta toxin family protein [Planctomycetota bacterium]